MKNLIIMGPPGSGKDTQIEKLKDVFDFETISTGEIARELSKKSPKVQRVIKEGGLVEDSLIFSEINNRLAQITSDKGVVFDGFPRTIAQAEELNQIMLHNGRTLDAVINIYLEEEVIVKRLSKRHICANCGADIPAMAEKCLVCGGRAVRREDDTPATVINRIQTFLERTLPLVSYYKTRGILFDIDGDQPVEKVAQDINEKLGVNV